MVKRANSVGPKANVGPVLHLTVARNQIRKHIIRINLAQAILHSKLYVYRVGSRRKG